MLEFIIESIKISIKNVLVYRFEIVMLFIHSIFEMLFILLFFYSVSNVLTLPFGYKQSDMFVFSALLMFSSAFSELFYAFNVLPYDINDGSFDLYLIRPKKIWLLYTMSNLNFVIVLEKIFLSIFMFLILMVSFNYEFNFLRFIISFVLIIWGTVILEMINFVISLLSFWFGVIDNLKMVMYSLSDIKKYPLGFLSKSYIKKFIFLIPLGLVTYYPLEIFLSRLDFSFNVLLVYFSVFISLLILSYFISKRGIRRYESNN